MIYSLPTIKLFCTPLSPVCPAVEDKKLLIVIIQVDMLWTRTVKLMMLLVNPISAICAVCLVGFASTWLVSQVGGRLREPTTMIVIKLVIRFLNVINIGAN